MAGLAIDQRQEAWAIRWGWLVIALAVMTAYWPLSSFQWAIAHGDTLNCWLPWRWFIASSLHDGQFPLWNPHQQFGYPMHADLQGPSWYVEAIALGGTVGHGLHVLQALYLLYLMIGGWGMMRLIRTVHGDARAALIIGTAYALGGFLTGHHQHFYAIISAAWVPWLLDSFIRLLREPGWRGAARVALLQGLLLTGGNHTFTIIGTYLLLALFGLEVARATKRSGWLGVRPLLIWAGAAAAGAAVIAAGALHAWWEAAPHLVRGGAIPYAAAADGSVTRTALLSLLFPFAPGISHEFIGADPSMGNIYMGGIILVLSASALLLKRSALENLLLCVAVICGLASLGTATPVHHWIWRWLPGMDVFRFPSYFHLFTWMALLVMAGGTLSAMLQGRLSHRRLMIPLALATAATIAGLVIGLLHAGAVPSDGSLFERMRALDTGWRMLLGAVVTLPLLLVALTRAWRQRLSFALLLGLILAEMVWNTSLAVWNTAVSDIDPAWVQRRLNALSDGPVLPEPRPLSAYDDNGHRLHYLAHATQDFIGGFSRNGVNSFWLRNAMELEVAHTPLWNAMGRQPVAYLAQRVVPSSAYVPESIVPERDSGLVVLMDDGHRSAFPPPSPADRVMITGFDRNSFSIDCTIADDGLLVLQQSHYPGWEAIVDGEPRPLRRVNIAAMAVAVPAGQHSVIFRYCKPIVPWLLALCMLAFFTLLFALAWPTGNRHLRLGAIALLSMTAWSLLAHDSNRDDTGDLLSSAAKRLPDNASVILNDDGTSTMPTRGDMVGWRLRADEPGKTGVAWSVLRAAEAHRTMLAPRRERELHWFDAAVKTDPAARAMILDHWNAELVARSGRSTHLRLSPRSEPITGRTFLNHDASALRWLHADEPYGGGTTLSLDSLKDLRDGTLVVDFMTTAPRATQAVIVLERKAGERTTAYRALPIAADAHERPAYAVQPIDEFWRPGEDLKIYLWCNRGDSISERSLRVRVLPRRFHAW